MKVGDELMSKMGIFSALYLSIKVSRDFLTFTVKDLICTINNTENRETFTLHE